MCVKMVTFIRSTGQHSSLEMDSLVWAKMRFCPYWPAKVVETPPELGPTPRNKVCVLFLGTKEFAFIPHDNIESYVVNRERFVKKGKGTAFRTAVQHMDEFISNNVKFRSHVYVKPKQKKIRIKTERDIERQIKVERPNGYEANTNVVNMNEPGDHNVTFSTQPVAVDSWTKEKKSLIDKIMALKSENQLLVKKSSDKDAQLDSMNTLKHELEIRLNEKDLEFSRNINELKKQLRIAEEKEASRAKSISDLKREISLLISQKKQLQTGLAKIETKELNSNSDDDDYYEVERLLDDKLVKERLYLVRWKGFNSSYDTWERESNLRCASILKKYKQSQKKY